MSGKKAVFLDRDGVINRVQMRDGKARAPQALEDFHFFPFVKEAIESLKNAGFLTIVVTNQPDVARGWQKKEIVDLMNEKVVRELAVDDLKVCFHDEADECVCRKPKAGMFVESATQWGIDLSRSYMIGDRQSDLEAGLAAGCASLLVGAGDVEKLTITPAAQVDSLYEAAQWILKKELDLANSPVFR